MVEAVRVVRDELQDARHVGPEARHPIGAALLRHLLIALQFPNALLQLALLVVQALNRVRLRHVHRSHQRLAIKRYLDGGVLLATVRIALRLLLLHRRQLLSQLCDSTLRVLLLRLGALVVAGQVSLRAKLWSWRSCATEFCVVFAEALFTECASD